MKKIAISRLGTIQAACAWCIVVSALPALLEAQPESNDPPAKDQAAKDQAAKDQAIATTRPKTAEGIADSPKRADDDPKPPREPSATDVLRELTRSKRGGGRPVIPPVQPGRSRTRVAPHALPKNSIVSTNTKLLPDGYRLVDRPGRLTRDGDYFVFAFESRGLGTPELPIRLLPNRLLEDMEIQSSGGTTPLVFIISGEVTEYHGVNYLLVQKLLIRPDLGNLR